MDRLNLRNTGSRIDFPEALRTPSTQVANRPRRLSPLASFYVSVLVFTGCSGAVIVTASYLALQIQ